MAVRITGGFAKGMNVAAPAGDQTRPTSAKVREAIWSSLQARMPCRHLLDLFAGSGAMGLEGLSRGAEAVTWVDASPRAVNCLRTNLKEIQRRCDQQDLSCGATSVVRSDVAKFLQACQDQFDLVFIDPPYDLVKSQAGLWLAQVAKLLAPDGLVVLESRKGEDVSAFASSGLTLVKEKTYGDTLVSYWEMSS